MKFTTNREALLAELNIFGGVVKNQPSDPLSVFSNVCFRASGDGCELTATGGEIGLRSRLAGEVEGDGVLSVPVGLVTSWLQPSRAETVSFEDTEQNWVEAHCGRRRIRIPGRVADPPFLPSPPEEPLATIPAATLGILLRTGSYAFPATADQTVATAGAQIEVARDDLRIVSSDHSRLAYASAKAGRGEGASKERAVFGIASKAIAQLQLLVGAGDAPVRFFDGESAGEDESPAVPGSLHVGNHIFFEFGPRLLVCAKLADRLPEYEHVVPRDCPIRIVMVREELLRAVQQALPVTTGEFHRGKVEIGDGSMGIEVSSVRGEEGGKVEVAEISGPPLTLQANLVHLRDFAKAFECETVSLEFNTEDTAFLLRPIAEGDGVEHFCVGMPLV